MTATDTRPAAGSPSDPPERLVPPRLRTGEWARWVWRQLTSMRVALLLLFALALAAIPGSVIPQRDVSPGEVATFRADHPELGRWFDRLSLFEVFGSPWFSAIYLLLMISLVGCLVPRARVHWQAIRARPPVTPRNLARMPAHRRLVCDADPSAVLGAAASHLRARRFRVDTSEGADGGEVRAEKGYLRETGNVVFHLSLLVILVGVAAGHLYGYRAGALVVEGEGMSNTVSQYDTFSAGPLFDTGSLPPFALDLTDFRAGYQEDGDERGAPRDFEATVDYTPEPGAESLTRGVRVNHPLRIGGAQLSLGAHGYAPVVTVTDGAGAVVFSGAVPFLPVDTVGLTSRGVVKVPDAAPEGLGFQGLFLPSAAFDLTRGPFSTFPAARNPRLVLNAWSGDLGLDSGIPQSVYSLDTGNMAQLRGDDGRVLAASLAVGDTMRLPDGLGRLTFDGYREWVVFNVNHDPGRTATLIGAVLALAGLLASLFVRPRRMWVRAVRGEDGRTVVDAAGLARSESPDVEADVDGLTGALPGGPSTQPPSTRPPST